MTVRPFSSWTAIGRFLVVSPLALFPLVLHALGGPWVWYLAFFFTGLPLATVGSYVYLRTSERVRLEREGSLVVVTYERLGLFPRPPRVLRVQVGDVAVLTTDALGSDPPTLSVVVGTEEGDVPLVDGDYGGQWAMEGLRDDVAQFLELPEGVSRRREVGGS